MKAFVIVTLALVIISALISLYKELEEDSGLGVLASMIFLGLSITSLVFVCIRM